MDDPLTVTPTLEQSLSQPVRRSANMARLEFLVAAAAATRWPPGRDRYSWFTTDQAEKKWHDTVAYRIPIAVARASGGPAVAVAALRAVTKGRNWIEWRDVWNVQTALLVFLKREGVQEYNTMLSEHPEQVARIFRDLAEEIRR